MASVAPAFPGVAVFERAGSFAVSRYEMRAAAALLGLLMVYGIATITLSGVAPASLAQVAGTFALATSQAVLFVLIAYLTLRTIIGRRYREETASRLFWLTVASVLTALTFPFFGAFKQMLLPVRGFAWDATLAHTGRALLGGTSPWQVTHALFGSVDGTILLDRLYSGWVPLIGALPLLIAVFMRDVRTKVRLIGSWFMAWVLIGTVAAWLFASAGPCYYNALVGADSNYAELQQRLKMIAAAAAARGHEITTLEFQPLLLQAFHGRLYAPAGGISAMPSMHVALATFCAIAGFQVNRWVGAIGALYALLIWIGSIHFGWHYFLDGPVAAALMLGIWRGSALIPGPQPAR